MSENYWDLLLEDDEHAASYMATYGEGPGAPTRHALGHFINDGESVLDVGCGPGWNFDHFMEHGPAISNYKGLDYSERFVRVANARVQQIAGTSTGPFFMGDVRKFDEPDKSWDVVIMQDVLEHTNGYKVPMAEAIRVARKRIIVAFWRMSLGDTDQTNDDGNDGYGSIYSKPKWEVYLDSLDLHWMHHQITDNKPRDFYIIDLEVQHGDSL